MVFRLDIVVIWIFAPSYGLVWRNCTYNNYHIQVPPASDGNSADADHMDSSANEEGQSYSSRSPSR